MLKIKRKTTIISTCLLLLAGMAVVGAIAKLADSTVDTYADSISNLPACTNIEAHTSYSDYTVVSSPISLTSDTNLSYIAPNQTTACSLIINLNGHTLTGYDGGKGITVGNNVSAIIDGGGGKIVAVNSMPAIGGLHDAAVITSEYGQAIVKNVDLDGMSNIINAGHITLENANSDIGGVWNVSSGELNIKSGNYERVLSRDGGTVVIDGGTYNSIVVSETTDLTINGGTFNGHEYESTITNASAISVSWFGDPTTTNNITVNGGTFNNASISSPATIVGGNFLNTTVASQSNISGGDFTSSTIKAQSEIVDGTFTDTAIEDHSIITDGTFTNSTIAENSTIQNGTFISTEIAENVKISGGTFDTIPEESNLVEEKKTIMNEDKTYSVVNSTETGAEPIPQCTNIKMYAATNNYTEISSPIYLSTDTKASYVVPDQSDTCVVTVKLNGYTLTGIENMATLVIGKNVDTLIDGANGQIVQTVSSSSTTPMTSLSSPAINISENTTAVIKNVSTDTSANGPDISNSGNTTLENVNTNGMGVWNFNEGDLTIESGNYNGIYSNGNGGITINGGSISEVIVKDTTDLVINNGDFDNSKISNSDTVSIAEPTNPTDTNNITINGGNYTDTAIESPATISGGTFNTEPDENNIPEGKTIVNNEDGTYSVIDNDSGNTGDSGDSGNTGDSGDSGNTGDSGDSGNTGDSGDSGNTGDSGDSGNTGDSGDSGNTGDSGDSGNTGDSGDSGNTGESSNTGDSGSASNDNDSGNSGDSGNTTPSTTTDSSNSSNVNTSSSSSTSNTSYGLGSGNGYYSTSNSPTSNSNSENTVSENNESDNTYSIIYGRTRSSAKEAAPNVPEVGNANAEKSNNSIYPIAAIIIAIDAIALGVCGCIAFKHFKATKKEHDDSPLDF